MSSDSRDPREQQFHPIVAREPMYESRRQMSGVHTYYDNLKVSRDAPDAVIRAAYRALAQHWHPDKNSDTAEAARVMKLINEAYETLSDPTKRSKHDLWIREQERQSSPPASQPLKPPPRPQPKRPTGEFVMPSEWKFPTGQRKDPRRPDFPRRPPPGAEKANSNRWVGWALGGGVLATVFFFNSGKTPAPESPPVAQQTPAEQPKPIAAAPPMEAFDARPPGWKATHSANGERLKKQNSVPATAAQSSNESPNATPAPPPFVETERLSRTGYMPGSEQGAGDGLSSFKVDNSQGGGDAVVRLYANGLKPAVRHFYVRQGQTFTAQSMSAGPYVMRYRYVGSEKTYEADKVFDLKEYKIEGGRRFSNVRVTLYTQRDGNMSTKEVSPDKF